ncbi:unnamed protein product [Rotaria socialis]|uniref:Uncharacterized protein n=1 Tax=Rotaria socialis TaxID=392032 RepID=A0A818Q4Z1_9BILA|nr:unnamed protein product [Rotaria socialis]CAF4636384.1 unnamed protein product [Rotaria socialis]
MGILRSVSYLQRTDSLSRVLIIIASFFAVSALTLVIVGIATPSWYSSQDSTGTFVYFNLFTQCVGNGNNNTLICTAIQRQTTFGAGTQNAAALLIVAICLLGCGTLITLIMIFIRLPGIMVLIAPVVLFLATLFMVVAFEECSKVTIYNSYSANLVQTSHIATIFAMGIIAFASGRLHFSSYQEI